LLDWIYSKRRKWRKWVFKHYCTQT